MQGRVDRGVVNAYLAVGAATGDSVRGVSRAGRAGGASRAGVSLGRHDEVVL